VYLLALETSNDACSVALSTPQGVLEKFAIAPRQHAELVLPMIDEVLAEAGVGKQQLQAIAYGQGPGAFIGVRIAASVTQGLALALNLPVLPVSSLAAMAQAFRDQARDILVANDARMNEVYFARYQSECVEQADNADRPCFVSVRQEESLLKPAQINITDVDFSQSIAIGSAWQVYSEQLAEPFPNLRVIPDVYPRAAEVAEIALRDWSRGVRLSAEQAQPLYIRNTVVQSPS